MKPEEQLKRFENELLNSAEDKTMTQEEVNANYWEWIAELRKRINELLINIQRARCVFKQYVLSNEVAERPDAAGANMEHALTGRRTLTIEFVDLDQQDAYRKWKAESEHEPAIIEASYER